MTNNGKFVTMICPTYEGKVLTMSVLLAGQAAASVIAMVDKAIVKALQGVFSTGLFRVYTNEDVLGCEMGFEVKGGGIFQALIEDCANE